jgi:hypothetical protein
VFEANCRRLLAPPYETVYGSAKTRVVLLQLDAVLVPHPAADTLIVPVIDRLDEKVPDPNRPIPLGRFGLRDFSLAINSRRMGSLVVNGAAPAQYAPARYRG